MQIFILEIIGFDGLLKYRQIIYFFFVILESIVGFAIFNQLLVIITSYKYKLSDLQRDNYSKR